MKKYICLFLCLLLLQGCAYYKNTLFRIKADILKLEPTMLGGIPKIEGERVSGTLNRQVYVGGSAEVPELSDIEIQESTETTDDSINITK